jgi:uncharacterized protein (DUF4213/DUF364 family)
MSLPSVSWRPRSLAEAAPADHPIYQELVAAIELGNPVTACVAGLVWTLVEAGDQAGLALTLHDGVFESQLPGRIDGRETRWLAEHITSWNMFDATLALGAINSYFNRRERVEAVLGHPVVGERGQALFERLGRRFAGGSVAVVGHFPHIEVLSEHCELTIIERQPSRGDLPDQASEYVLGRQDCVCITGSAFTNKTLPRLLDLSHDAYVVLVGPSVPLATLWFDHGVDLLAGTVVLDPPGALAAVQQGGRRSLFGQSLAMVEIEASDLAPH